VLSLSTFHPPSFCIECGVAYPWTEAALHAALELADEADDLSSDEKEQLKGTFNDLISETPRTAVATTRIKRLVAMAGSTTASALRGDIR
jgi:hypothetical protein